MSNLFTGSTWPPYKIRPVDRNSIEAPTFHAPKTPLGTRAEIVVTSDRVHPDGTCPKVLISSFVGSRSKEPDADGYYSFELKIKIKEIKE